jgi:hypothetical protein
MNEADTPDNGVWRKPSDASVAQPSNTGCPFYSVVANDTAIPKLLPARVTVIDQRNQYHQFPVEEIEADVNNQANTNPYIDSEHDQVLTLGNEQWETQIMDDANRDENIASETPDIPVSEDWVAEPDREKEVAVNSEFQQLLTLNQDLLAANEKLYDQVEELTLTLTESEKALQLQKKRSSVTETMLKQQTSELTAAQNQIESLYQQLDASLQNVQRQETLIETYKAQFELSLTRLAQLERECALLQATHNEQSQHLLQSETACRELRTRLMRQQRQTLQFKAALEKCLETPIPTPQEDLTENDFNDNTIEPLSPSLKKFRSLFVNADPIRPWSADEAVVEENEDILRDTSFEFTSKAVIHEEVSKQNSFAASEPDEKATTWEQTPPTASPSLEEQIDSVIKIFFTSQSGSTEAQMPFQLDIDDHEIERNASESPITDTPIEDTVASYIWDDTQTIPPQIPPQIVEECLNTAPFDNTIAVKSDLLIEPNDTAIYAEPVIETTPNAQDESEDYWAEVSQLNHLDLPATDSPLHPSHDTNDVNSPSPVVYPKRPPKGRKSLASVELPKFCPPQS